MNAESCASLRRPAGRRALSSRWPTITVCCCAAWKATTSGSKSCSTAYSLKRTEPRNRGMSQTLSRDAAPQLLHYRPWRGELRSPAVSVWPIARIALGMMVRRKLFWVLYGLGLMLFLLFFFGQYLFAFAEAQETDAAANRNNQGDVVKFLRNVLKLDGSAESYQAFFHYQGYIV